MSRVGESLDACLPKGGVEAALREVLDEDSSPIKLDGREVITSPNVRLEVVARSFHSYEFDIGFGPHFRALVAIGGVKDVSHGVADPEICFATLYFSLDASLITLDFSDQMP